MAGAHGVTHCGRTMRASLVLVACCLAACATAPRTMTNSLGMRFVEVPAGEFTMGSAEPSEALRRDYPQLEQRRFDNIADEAPPHRVRITRAFWLGQHEVTVGQFRRFVEASGH